MVIEQPKEYTIKELCSILSISDNVARKKIRKYKLLTDQQLINNRLTTVVKLDDTQLNALKQEISFNKSLHQPLNNNSSSTQQLEENKQNQVITKESADLPILILIEQIKSTFQLLVDEKDKRIQYLEKELERERNKGLFGFFRK